MWDGHDDCEGGHSSSTSDNFKNFVPDDLFFFFSPNIKRKLTFSIKIQFSLFSNVVI